MNNMSKNWKSAIFYILIPILLVALALGFANRQNQTDLKYSQVVHLFKTDQVKSFEIDLTSGSLTYSTFEEPDKVQKYNVPSVTYFLDDIRDSVDEYNEKIPIQPLNLIIKEQFEKLDLFAFAVCFDYRFRCRALLAYDEKMGDTMNSDTSRTLGFGRVKTKRLKIKTRKPFPMLQAATRKSRARRNC